MDWMSKHVDTVIIIGSIITSMLWMNHQFNAVDGRFANIEKDMAVIKAVMVLRQILPPELAKHDDIK